MIFKVGKTISIGKNYIIFESNYTGYIIYVPNPKLFKKEKIIRLYLYEHHNEFTKTLYGFMKFEERIMFEDLLSVQGVGPKTSIQLLSAGFNNLCQYIVNQNLSALKEMPYIGERTASMIIFELKNKYIKWKNKNNQNHHDPQEIAGALKTLGFGKEQIEFAISKLKPNKSVEFLVEEAIKIISNAKQFKTPNI